MTATTTPVAQPGLRRGLSRFTTFRILAVTGRILVSARNGWSRLAITGQLGTPREREIGRHTGARI